MVCYFKIFYISDLNLSLYVFSSDQVRLRRRVNPSIQRDQVFVIIYVLKIYIYDKKKYDFLLL